MFVDSAQINLKAGKGGDGLCSFLRLLYNPNAGPDGGDGGMGGCVFFEASSNLNTLYDYRSTKHFRAQDGTGGGKNNKKGKTGEDLILKVPVGTQVQALNGDILCDLNFDGAKFMVVKGGRGGYGNAHFKGATRQAPKFAELGEPGEVLDVKLELMLMADIALVGMPSVGKSSLISTLTSSKAEVAAYHFTTLVPNLGVLDPSKYGFNANNFVLADVPGLIEGASHGKGLGHEFLKHVKRSSALLLVLDADSMDISNDAKVMLNELKTYQDGLEERVQAFLVNKSDLLDEASIEFLKTNLVENFPDFTEKIFFVSAATTFGLKELVQYMLHIEIDQKALLDAPEEKLIKKQEYKVYTPHLEKDPKTVIVNLFKEYEAEEYGEIVKIKVFNIKGERLEQIVNMSVEGNQEADSRIYDVCKKLKVFSKMIALGAKPGDEFMIADRIFKYFG